MIVRALLTVLTVAACEYEDTLRQVNGYPRAPDDATTDAATADVTTGDMSGSIETVTGGASTNPGDDTTTGAASTGDEVIPSPAILAIDMPVKVKAAGPVDVVVLAEHAATVRGVLSSGEAISFNNEGDVDGSGADSFVATFPIFGSVDNGDDHELEVIAERGDLEHRITRGFEVATPAAGTLAWERYGGPGSGAKRLVLTPEGDVYEGGSIRVGEIERPAFRKLDAVKGTEAWGGGPITVDTREGSIADIALAPDGRLWVAMNVREGNTWHARIALFEPNGQPTGIEIEKPGATLTAIDSDGDGGCFAVGFATTIHGDADVMMWRISGEGVPLVSGQPWDYQPENFPDPHEFTDLAFDVVVDPLTAEAWIVGASQGKHDPDLPIIEGRGLILRVDIDTLEILGPVIVLPVTGGWTQSMFLGADLDPEGVLVVGNECNWNCSNQRLIARRYDAAGMKTWEYHGENASAAYGSSVARNAHGTVLIAATVKEGTVMRGRLLGRRSESESFAPFAFPGTGASGANSVVVGPYDWAFGGGNVTVDGASQAYVMHPHQ